MHRPLFARLLLIFALLFAQLGGLTHGIAHALEEHAQSTDQSLPHDKHCDLCAAYAQIGSAMTSPGISLTGTEACEILHLCNSASCTFQPFAAFAARAPPCPV
jgi:hypothetical protein